MVYPVEKYMVNRINLHNHSIFNNNKNKNIDTFNTKSNSKDQHHDYHQEEHNYTHRRDSVQCHQDELCEDQSAAVESFFSSIRVPSSFIVGVSFSEMFSSVDEDKNNSTVQHLLHIITLTCQGFTFGLSLSVIVLSSSALVRALTANFDPYAENGYELLFREFHFEFVCVRWAYNMSMLGFLLAVGSKILYEFELFNFESDNWERSHLEIGIAVVLIISALAMHLFAYMNSTLVGWENYFDMTLDLLRMIYQRGKTHYLEATSSVVLFIGLLFLILAMIPGAQI